MSHYRQHHPTVRPPSPWALSAIAGACFIVLLYFFGAYLDQEPEASAPQEVQVQP